MWVTHIQISFAVPSPQFGPQIMHEFVLIPMAENDKPRHKLVRIGTAQKNEPFQYWSKVSTRHEIFCFPGNFNGGRISGGYSIRLILFICSMFSFEHIWQFFLAFP